ncbi:hypothetical protein GGS20DRAFT_97881 [Poronia punctata]|nr:hypothetical protein GGS20DRAFT_97881 [Poronia punctata]
MSSLRDSHGGSSTRGPLGVPVLGRVRRRSRSRGSGGGSDVSTTRVYRGYNEDENNTGDQSIPRVPRIPDRFLPRSSTLAESTKGRTAGSSTSLGKSAGKAGNLNLLPAPHTRHLPGCSSGQPKEVQIVSNSMMKAYIAMRGNWLGGEHDQDDPLFDWIRRREELRSGSKHTIRNERDISRMLAKIDKALDAANAGGDSPRDHIFEVYRPDFSHIKPPSGMDLSTHEFTTSCADFEWEKDSDDEEADLNGGRISPCTFLEWSKGCVRWNEKENEYKVSSEVTSSYRRMRPPTPKDDTVPSQKQRRRAHTVNSHFEFQRDFETGEELTPAYEIPSSPSIIFTPPGLEVVGPMPGDFRRRYSRMVPLVERDYRNHLYGARIMLPTNLSQGDATSFTSTEVNAAVQDYIPELHAQGHPQVFALLRRQWKETRQTEVAWKELFAQTQRQTEAITGLEYDLHYLQRCMPALQLWREEKDEAERKRRADEAREERRKQRRIEEIKARVANHAREAQSHLDDAWDKLYTAQAAMERNSSRIAALKHEIQNVCASVGVRDPEHAFAVLMDEEADDDDVEDADERGSENVVDDGTVGFDQTSHADDGSGTVTTGYAEYAGLTSHGGDGLGHVSQPPRLINSEGAYDRWLEREAANNREAMLMSLRRTAEGSSYGSGSGNGGVPGTGMGYNPLF